MPTAASSGAIFGGSNTGALMELYERALAAGMSTDRAISIINSDVDPQQFLAQIEQLEQRSTLGTPAPTTARTGGADASSAGLTRAIETLFGQQAAAQQLTPEQQAWEDRFGNDAAWTDPYFQRQATTVAPVTSQDALRFGTTADPEAQAQERRAIDQLFARASAGPSAGEQAALNTQTQAIRQLFDRSNRGPSQGEAQALAQQQSAVDRMFQAANEGASPEERAGLDTEMAAARDLLRRAGEGATAEERQGIADQRRAMDALFGDYEQGASDVELEAQAGQRRTMDDLYGLWEGGGATALERARRAQARAESENWLEGQRLADMQDLAERGYAGSGAEIASLARDRQDAASRLSLADLETDAALEERAMQALLASGGQAGELLSGESNIQARRLQQLLGAGGAARGISDTLGNIEGRSTQQLAAGGGMAGDVASGWGDIEERLLAALQGASAGSASMAGTYGDIEQRGLQALLGANTGAANLTGAYGDIESRALDALMGARAGATDVRNASDRYVQQNADRLFDASTFNAEMIDGAARDNQQFVQAAYRDMIDQRTRWDMQTRDLQTAVARDLLGSDVQETQYGFGQGYDTAASDTGRRNTAQQNHNTTTLGAYTGLTPLVTGAAADQSAAAQAGLRTGGQTFQQAGNAVANYFSGGAAGVARQPYSATQMPAGAVVNPTAAQNPYRNYGRY